MKKDRKSRKSTSEVQKVTINNGSKGTFYSLTQDDVQPRKCICGKATLKPFLCNTADKTVSSNPVFTPCLIGENQQVVLAVDKVDAEIHLQRGIPKHAVLIVHKDCATKRCGACISFGSAILK